MTTLDLCDARHACPDGHEGTCGSLKGHLGKHVCSRCSNLFLAPAADPREGGVRDEAHVCGAKHKCRDGGHGVCDSVRRHAGSHLCSRCDSLFVGSDKSAATWCRQPCPECASACRRQAGHYGTHVCEQDHSWHAGGGEACGHGKAGAAGGADAKAKCAHKDHDLGSWSRVCGFCGYRICGNCDESNCPAKSPVWQAAYNCAHGAHDLGNGSRVCGFCGYRICKDCDEQSCPRKDVPAEARGWKCAHRDHDLGSGSRVCGFCGYRICKDCDESNCPVKDRRTGVVAGAYGCRADGTSTGGKGPKCAHRGHDLGSGSRVCGFCGCRICKDCDESNCPAKGETACGHAHHHHGPSAAAQGDKCAHGAHNLAGSTKVCDFCEKYICATCDELSCPTKAAGKGWKCAHHDHDVGSHSRICGFCGYRICSNCDESSCPAKGKDRPPDPSDPAPPNPAPRPNPQPPPPWPEPIAGRGDKSPGGARAASGCFSSCPICSRYCTLNTGHYHSHTCSQGHSW